MSGIHAYFNPAGVTPAAAAAFRERLRTRVSAVPGLQVDVAAGRTMIAASAHHGVLPSGGAVRRGDLALVATGSAWTDPDAGRLARPADILAAVAHVRPGDGPLVQGTCALAWADDAHRTFAAQGDVWSTYPLYYRREGSGWLVSSSLRFLADAGRTGIDEAALAEWLTLGFVSRTPTVLAGITRLAAKTRLRIGPDGPVVDRYPWRPAARTRPFDADAAAEYDDLIRAYLRRFRAATPALTVSMSGGLDSRLVSAAALREGFDLAAFTVGESGSVDAQMAARMCELLGVPLVNHVIDGGLFPQWVRHAVWTGEGRAAPDHLHYLPARLGGGVPPGPVLMGMWGEVHLGGHYDVASLMGAAPAQVEAACRDLVDPRIWWRPGGPGQVLAPTLSAASEGLFDRVADDLMQRQDFSGAYADYLEFRIRLKGITFMNPCLLSQVVPWADVVNPFYDDRAFALGQSCRLEDIDERRGQLQWGLAHLPVIGELPRIKAGVLVDIADSDPEAYRRGAERLERMHRLRYLACRATGGRFNPPLARSFPEYGQWYRRHRQVRSFVDDVLLDERTLDRGFFRREGVRAMLHDLRVGRNVWPMVGACLFAELFLRQFVDGVDRPMDLAPRAAAVLPSATEHAAPEEVA